jgi:23S rRNA pseudouridine1911/1915/1917 synthase
LLLICTTQTSYDRMLEAQKNGLFIKKYNAQCDLIPDNIDRLGGFPVLDISGCIKENTGFEVESYFRPYGEGRKTVRPVTGSSCNAGLKKSGTVLYHTQVNVLKIEQEKVYAECEISAGFRHQVRCHLAWCGIPVSGDMLYNSQYVQDQVLQFECTELRFPHPLTDKVIIYSLK